MDAQEIYNLPISELVTNIFCIDWSEDNQISLLTEKGVHIFELQPNPLCPTPTVKFKRSFLYATDYLPTETFKSITEKILNNSTKENFYSLLLEEALTPKISDKSEHIPRIIQLSWSPARLVTPSRCLLATVTSAGAVDLAFRIGKNWFSVCNLSTIWWENVKIEMEFTIDDDPDSIDADKFRNNVRRLQGTSVAWSKFFENSGKSFAYLVVAYRSCEIVIWKIDKISELQMNLNIKLIYKKKFNDNGKISKIQWISLEEKRFIIILGFFDGKIYGLQLNEINGNLIENSTINYENYPDKISISFIGMQKLKNGKKFIIVTKNFSMIFYEIDDNGNVLNQKYLNLLGFSITGIVLFNDSEAIVSTQDSKLHHIDLNSKILTSKLLNHDMKSSKVQYLGLCKSVSSSIFINVTSPNTVYDHLVNREPSNLQLFILKKKTFDPWEILNASDNNLNIYWECLEIIRIRAAKSNDPEELLPKIPDELDQSLSVHKLRIIMWLTLMTEVIKKKKIIKKIDNVVGEISEAQPLIFVHTASSYMIKLSKKKNLNNNHYLSINFLRLYLEVFLAGEEDDFNKNNKAIEHAKDAIEATSKLNLIQTEPCNLCGEIVTELPWNTSSCPRGHKLPRCAFTFLQITSLKYRNCPICGRIFHPSLDEEYDDVKCLYCDVYAVYDSRISGIYDDVDEKCKNLSLRPSWDISTIKNQEIEGEENKKKRKRSSANVNKKQQND